MLRHLANDRQTILNSSCADAYFDLAKGPPAKQTST